jgi:hypothetical protein
MSPEKSGQATGGGEEVASVLRHKKVMSSKRELWLFRVPENFDASSLRYVSSSTISPYVTLATNEDRAREGQTPEFTKQARIGQPLAPPACLESHKLSSPLVKTQVGFI